MVATFTNAGDTATISSALATQWVQGTPQQFQVVLVVLTAIPAITVDNLVEFNKLLVAISTYFPFTLAGDSGPTPDGGDTMTNGTSNEIVTAVSGDTNASWYC